MAVSDEYAAFTSINNSFQFPSSLFGSQQPVTQTGSPYGAPPPNFIAGQGPGPGTNLAAYGSSASSRPTSQQPIFWSIVLTVLGVLGLGFIAHMEVRRG